MIYIDILVVVEKNVILSSAKKINELDHVYYSFPYWDPIRNTWLAVAQQIPILKEAMIKHQMVLKFHIKIPYSYWQNKYNDWNNPLVYTKNCKPKRLKNNR